MGQKDITEKILADYNDVFSDIVNVLIFHGENIVKEDHLENTKDISQYKADGNIHQQERDISKLWRDKNIIWSLIGFEHQSDETDDMPFRVCSYDGAGYRKQLLGDAKERYPVITMVLYFGTEHKWNKATKLSDVLDIPEGMESYFHDYGINVFNIAFLSDEEVELFQSDFKIVADYFVQMRKNKQYKPSAWKIKHVDEILKIMSVLTGDYAFEQAQQEADKFPVSEEGEISMAAIFSPMLEEREARGIAIGEARGENLMADLIKKLISLGRSAEVERVASDVAFREKLYQEFGLKKI